MCVYSVIGDEWSRRYPQEQPWIQPYTNPPFAPVQPNTTITFGPEVTRAEFEELKRELESLKKLLKAAKIYDEESGHPDCEVDEKVGLIRRLAELVGVDMSDIFDE